MKTVLDNGMVLRPADADDLRYISDCIASTLKASVPDEEASLSDLWTGTTVAAALDSLSTRKMQDEAFILTDGTGNRGMLWMGISRDQYTAEETGYLLGIYVSEELRGRGIGRELVSAAESWCVDKGLYTMQLDVSPCNEPAYSLYTSSGYTVRSAVMTKTLKR